LDFFWKIKKYSFVAFFTIALVALILPGDVLPDSTRSVYYLWESGHLFLFFLGWHIFYTFCPRFLNLTSDRQLAILLGTTFLCVVVLEGLQSSLSGKPLSFIDVLGDTAGTLLFLSFRSRTHGNNNFFLHGAALLLTGFVLWPVLYSFADERLARYQFPLLADFETPFEASRFEGKAGGMSSSREQAFHGKSSLRLSLFPGPWSGVMLKYFPSNWRGYNQLHFAVYNPDRQPVFLEVSIHDTLHEQGNKPYNDLYSRIISLPAGWTRIQIPLEEVQRGPQNRQMDLTHIRGLGFFVERETNPLALYLDNIRLE
jgi:hypothetical protein